jgi:hypothetical protein
MDYSLYEKYERTSDALFWLRKSPMKVELSMPAELSDYSPQGIDEQRAL